MLERNTLIPLEVNLRKETPTLLWYWPCSGKLPCFPLPTLQYQCEMFTSRVRLNVLFLRSFSLVISMYISEKRDQSDWLTKQPARTALNASILLCKSYPHFDILVWTTLRMRSKVWLNPVKFSQQHVKTSILCGLHVWNLKLPGFALNLLTF